MATYTENYNLVKPSLTENYSVGNDNGNMDIIDQQMKANADDIADLQESGAKITILGGWYRKVGNVVYLYINTSNSTYTNGQELFTLPLGYRPIYDFYFVVTPPNGGNARVVHVDPSGIVNAYGDTLPQYSLGFVSFPIT